MDPQQRTYGAGAPPVCPRHPDRVSYVSCQRCGRPVCPECQRQAAVGVQCVDCVARQRRDAPRTRSVGTSRPTVTYAIIALCVIGFLLQLAVPEFTRWFLDFTPYLPEQPWRMLTAGFLHDDSSIVSMHLILNMISLWFLGRVLEPAIGHARMLAVFLIGVIGGSVGFAFLGSASETVIGASGGIFALGGALLVLLRRDRQNLIAMAVILGVNLVYGFVVSGISWQAHVGGLVTGLLLGLVYTGGAGRRRPPAAWHLVASLLIAAILVVAGIYGGQLATDELLGR